MIVASPESSVLILALLVVSCGAPARVVSWSHNHPRRPRVRSYGDYLRLLGTGEPNR